jgi:AraC family transcriptional regulator of adaptative response / DNA-3-methyladenine glycosylase II
VIEVDLGGDEPHLQLVAHLPTFDSIIDDVSRIRQMFGLDDHVEQAEAHLGADPLLAPLVRRRPGIRVIGGWDRFETAVRVVVGQQISVTGAATITGRIVARHGSPLAGTALGLTHVFPTADALIALRADGLGMPSARVATISALARAVTDGDVDLYSPDPSVVRERLVALPGIGPWTAEVIAMRAIRDPDAFPASDLGLRQAVGRLLGAAEPPSPVRLLDLAERWRPYRALAAQHLWASLRPPAPSPHPSPHEEDSA